MVLFYTKDIFYLGRHGKHSKTLEISRGCRGQDHKLVGFITTYDAISAYHHGYFWSCCTVFNLNP